MSVIITPDCYQESHDIQDLTVKSTIVNHSVQSPPTAPPRTEDQCKGTDYIAAEYVGLECPQCGSVPNNTSARLVHDSCGHLKCRMCLLKEEDSCMTCEGQKMGMMEVYMEEREEPVRPPVIEERGMTMMLEPHEQEEPQELPVLHVPSPPESVEDPLSMTDCDDPGETEATEKLSKRKKTQMSRKHIITLPGAPPSYNCTICGKIFKTRAHKGYHEFCGSKEKPYHCGICNRGFVAKAHFLYHQRLHSGERPFKCNVCEKSFNQQSKLTRHLRVHTGERPFVCELCGKGFSNSHSMQNHLRTHGNVRPHECPHCSKCFTERSNLKKHIISTHTTIRPYVCDKCGKDFTLRWALNQHYRTHSGMKGYKCSSCDKSFITRRDLKRHSNTHNNARKYQCLALGCNVATSRKDNLERHMRGIHPELYPENGTDDPLTQVHPENNTQEPLIQEPQMDADTTTVMEPARPNAVPVINAAPHSSTSVVILQSLPPLPPLVPCSGYTTRNLHPETSPHLFVSSKNLPL